MRTSAAILQLLQQYESRNVTYVAEDHSWPIVWEKARGVYVWDIEGRKYLDLTGAFGVAAAGHSAPQVVAAGQKQMGRLLHAMGDVHPHRLKAELVRELSRITFERWTGEVVPGPRGGVSPLRGKTILCNSGFEAVEAALKTAFLATGKPGIIGFEGAYHGLGYGALNATHRDHFRGPFRAQLREFGEWLPFPAGPEASCDDDDGDPQALDALASDIRRLCRRKPIGAIIVEPVQVRGGINVPPRGFLPLLRKLCDEQGLVLILDEIYTGFGRTGKWFTCEHTRTVPDLICLGKALTGGFPLSACVGKAELMDRAWPVSTGEAIHTSTFLGHPVGCAMALENIRQIAKQELVDRSAKLGAVLLAALRELAGRLNQRRNLRASVRGMGCLAGLALVNANGSPATKTVLECLTRMLRRGFILLPEGEYSNVISFTPPLVIKRSQVLSAVGALSSELLGKRTAPIQ